MARGNQALNIVIRAKDLAKGTLRKLTARLRDVGRNADGANGAFSRLTSRVRNFILAAGGIYAVQRAMRSVLAVGDKYERLGIQMEALMGSIESGQQATAWIKEFTKSTPLQLDQVTNAFVTLKNFGLDPMDGTLLSLVDQNAKLGGEFERLQRISLALGQAFGKQKLQGEEIRQLIEASVPVWSLLEKATGRNTQELRKMSEAGELGTDVIKQLVATMGATSQGAAAKNMKILSGLVSNMKDRWEIFQKTVAESGWADYVKAQLTSLGNKLDEMANNGQLQELASNISATFITIAETIKAFFADLTIEDFVKRTTDGFKSIADSAGTVITVVASVGNGISAMLNSFSLVVKGAGAVIATVIGGIADGVADLVGFLGFEDLEAKVQHFADGMIPVSKAFGESMAKDAHKVRESYKAIGKAITTETPKIADTLKQVKAEAESSGEVIVTANKKVEKSQTKMGIKFADTAKDIKKSQKEVKEEVKDLGPAFDEAGEASENANEKMAGGMTIAQAMADHMGALKSELAGMSGAALAAFEGLNDISQADPRTVTDDIESMRHSLEQTNEELDAMGQAFHGFDATGLSEWMYDTKKTSLQVKESYLEQKIAFEDLIRSYEDGGLSAEQFASAARTASNEMELLNQQDMDKLKRALEQAERQMHSLQNSTRSTLEGLQDELDRLDGNTEAIERRRFEARNRDLEQKLKQARSKGDGHSAANLQQALSLNQRVFNKTRDKRENEERETRRRKSFDRAPPPRNGAGQRNESPSKVIRLEYPGGNVNVSVRQGDDVKLLRALKESGARAI